MNPKISIIIPAYNVGEYLEACLTSMLAQTLKEIEIIVINDGSTDQTASICNAFKEMDSRINIVHKKNEGVSIARNTGIDLATGKYLCFFDGDDFIEHYTCEELYKLAESKQVDSVIYGYHRFEEGKIKMTCPPIFSTGYYDKKAILEQLLPKFIGFSFDGINSWLKREKNALYVENPALWRILVSRSMIKEHHLTFKKELKVGEDTIFICEYLSHSTKCYVHPACYYYLVSRETSTIALYEKNPIGKLQGKIDLLSAREELSTTIFRQTKLDIRPFWKGTIVMSVIEMAFLLSKKNKNIPYKQRYALFLTYANSKKVRNITEEFYPTTKGKILALPFHLVRKQYYLLLFFSATLLHLIHYEFVRN